MGHPFWPPIARQFAVRADRLRDEDLPASHSGSLAGLGLLASTARISSVLEHMEFFPSRGRLRSTVVSAVAAGSQPTGRALPMLLPEGLGKLPHFYLALRTPHPYTLPPELLPRATFGLSIHKRGLLNLQRLRLSSLITLIYMRVRLEDEWASLVQYVHPEIRGIVQKRCVSFLRELHAAVGTKDGLIEADYVLGLPMCGPACQAPNFPPASRTPECSVHDLLITAPEHNPTILQMVRPSGDDKLDADSWEKSQAEFDCGSLAVSYTHLTLPTKA